MDLVRLEIKRNIQKTEDTNLSFRVFDLNVANIDHYLQPHKKDHFCILAIESGTVEVHIEDQKHFLKAGKISIVFPDQVHFISNASADLAGKVILFEVWRCLHELAAASS